MNDVVLLWLIQNELKKKQTRKPDQINIDDCSSNVEYIMDDECEQNEALDLDENLVLV